MGRIEIDHIGPLTTTMGQNSYILVAVDCHSKFVELLPCKDVTVNETAKALLPLFGRWGAWNELVTQ